MEKVIIYRKNHSYHLWVKQTQKGYHYVPMMWDHTCIDSIQPVFFHKRLDNRDFKTLKELEKYYDYYWDLMAQKYFPEERKIAIYK